MSLALPKTSSKNSSASDDSFCSVQIECGLSAVSKENLNRSDPPSPNARPSTTSCLERRYQFWELSALLSRTAG